MNFADRWPWLAPGRRDRAQVGHPHYLKSIRPHSSPPRRLIPISNYLLPALPANVPVADAAPPFKRPEPLKRASCRSLFRPRQPRTGRADALAESRDHRADEHDANRGRRVIEPIPLASSRSSSYDEQRDDPYQQDRPRSRQSTLPLEKRERPRSREASLPVEADAARRAAQSLRRTASWIGELGLCVA